MIVKIENLEQEKYVLECAENDDRSWISGIKPTGKYLSSLDVPFPLLIGFESYSCYIVNKGNSKHTHTFEQFKAQREEPIKTDLEKKVEELEKKLKLIRGYVNTEITQLHEDSTAWMEGYTEAMKRIQKMIQTPSQTEANEIIKNASDEVLEELKKLL
tara:strand:+ start:562 stop:1035 length:474 start_codon:yes stop_codon:yes gene_type:complete